MEPEATEGLALTQHGLITRVQALGLGLSTDAVRHRVSSGRWRVVARGIYRLAGAMVTDRQRAMAAVLATGPGAGISHESAAALQSLPGFDLEPLVVSVTRDRRRLHESVRVEQSLHLPAHHLTVIDGIPCTTVARTLFDLGGKRKSWGRVARAMDTALARRMVTKADLWRVLIDLAERGRDGTVMFRTLLEERGGDYVAPESELERRFIALARNHGLPEPERQVDLGDEEWIGRVDFLFRKARIVVEVDGAEFHDGLLDRRRVEQRDARLGAAGWYVLRFRWADVVERPTAVAQAIRFRCELKAS
jgi:very-short-patch-repair endonuclease/predicted transcriptional regulator of viral defense system